MLTIITQSASWVRPSLHDGFAVLWIHHGTENCTYFMHTRLCSHTLNCNLFNHIKSPIFSLIFSGAIYIRVARMADACAIRLLNKPNSSADASSLWEFGRSNHGIVTSGICSHARRATFWSRPGLGFQNIGVSPKLQGNIWDCNQRTDS